MLKNRFKVWQGMICTVATWKNDTYLSIQLLITISIPFKFFPPVTMGPLTPGTQVQLAAFFGSSRLSGFLKKWECPKMIQSYLCQCSIHSKSKHYWNGVKKNRCPYCNNWNLGVGPDAQDQSAKSALSPSRFLKFWQQASQQRGIVLGCHQKSSFARGNPPKIGVFHGNIIVN